MMKFVALVVALCVAQTYAKFDGFCDGKQLNANYPHPTECGKYIQCSDFGLGYEFSCPSDLHFNPYPRPYGFCDHPENWDCKPLPDPTTEGPVEPTTTPFPPDWCKDKDLNANYPHPTKPAFYIQCSDFGIPYVMPCPSGTIFESQPRPYGKCEYPPKKV